MRLALLALVLAIPQAASAEDPLVLRIRPQTEAPEEIGTGNARASEAAEAARRAFLAREAVWERSTVRARIAIASICRGCLDDRRPPTPAIADEPAPERQPQASPP